MNFRRTLPAIAILALVGCAQAPAAMTAAPAAAPAAAAVVGDTAGIVSTANASGIKDGVDVHAKLALRGSADRRLMAPAEIPEMFAFTAAHVGRVHLALYYVGDDGRELVKEGDLDTPAEIAGTISFTKLAYDSSYEVVATAYHKDDDARQIDNTVLSEAEGDDAELSCTTAFETGYAEDVTIPGGEIKLQLAQYVYDGLTEAVGVEIATGTVTDIEGDEDIVATPAQ